MVTEQRERRPADHRAAVSRAGQATGSTPIVGQDADTLQITARRRWAYRLIRRCTEPPPVYGTVEWLALPEGSVARIAAVVVAAEAWARSGDDLEANLRREVEVGRAVNKQLEDEDYASRAAAHREQWQHLARVVPFTIRRQVQLDAAKPRPGDHPGGPVLWNGGGTAS